MEIDKAFIELKEKAKELNLDNDKLELINLIEIEAKTGLPFADKIQKIFPELLTPQTKTEEE